MSYPPNQGWGQQGQHQQQQQWGQQYPAQGQQQYPPQQQPYGYPPQPPHTPYGQQPAYGQPGYPPQGHPQGPPPPPTGQYPPAQQSFGYPPQGHSPQPPAGYGQPGYPQAAGAYPPQGPPQGYPQGYQQPPSGLPPAGPPSGQFMSPPPTQAPYGAPMGPRPSLGYDVTVPCHTDMTFAAQQLRDAMQGVGTDEKKVIQVLAEVPDPVHMLRLRHTYDDRFKRSLLRDLESETSGHFRTALVAVARGPLLEDAHLVHQAIAGLGTKESMLNDVVLGRSNADLNAIKQCFHQIYKRDMAREISDDLSMKTEHLFKYVLQAARAEESAAVLPHDIDAHVDRLHNATEAHRGFSVNQDEVSKIMAFSSDGMIRAIDQRYKQKHHKSLDDIFSRHFSGHMKEALRLMAARAIDPIKSDADQLEASMKGMGTKDELLIERLVRSHWNKDHFRQVKIAYQRFHGRNLNDRIHGETSGDYRRMLLALCA